MTLSEYLSKRISWDPPLQLPRLSIPSVFRPQPSTAGRRKYLIVDDTSTEITAISYPKSPNTSRRTRIRAYIRRISGSFIRRSKPREEVLTHEPNKANLKLDTANLPTIQSIFRLPPSPSPLSSSSISPTLSISESPVMSQLRGDRAIRAEQDAAYERAQKLDQERLKNLREERIKEEERLKKIAEQEEQERVRERNQNDWRRWARRARMPSPHAGNSIRFAVRLPCGKRCIGNLPSDASLETLHVFIETLLIPSSFSPQDDPEDPPEGYEHCWGFRLVITNTRFIVPNDPNATISGIEVMKKGALLIIEEIEGVEGIEDATLGESPS